MDVQWELDGLRFNAGIDDDGVEWGVESEIGWSGTTAPKTIRTPRPGGHGSYRGPVYRGERIVELTCFAVAETWEARRRAEHRLAALCSEPGLLYPLLCTEEIGDLTADVELDATIDPIISRGGYSLRFAIQVAAPDPRKYGPWISGVAELPAQPTGGLDATTAGGLDATTAGGLDAGGVGPTGLVTVENTGRAPSSPLVQFDAGTADLVNPELADVVTGDVLRYTGTVPAGQSVWINTSEHPSQYSGAVHPARSVLLGGPSGVDRGGLLALVGDWPAVAGQSSSTWAFRATSGAASARARIYLRAAQW
ncbi:hypothetical protein PV646_28835 [Streptomyces sp. ID05-26A]|nr:hypothetical protein [Streptomyces sp. ID05-26A]